VEIVFDEDEMDAIVGIAEHVPPLRQAVGMLPAVTRTDLDFLDR
jgi:hypothetical protein